jgi:hypothetical protein
MASSDIHGDYGAMVRTLQKASVLDDELAWSGGNTHLVIVGDIVDRGADSRVAMDLLMRLEDEANSAGGKICRAASWGRTPRRGTARTL